MSENKLGCKRSGMCCTNLTLHHSPKVLREAYEGWRDRKPKNVEYDDIFLIYPMLEGRCKGKIVYPDGHAVYLYGPCRNLDMKMEEGKLQHTCGIHKNKPKMCSGFPFYNSPQEIQMNSPRVSNPSPVKGCGFNTDPAHGEDFAGYALVALSDDEK